MPETSPYARDLPNPSNRQPRTQSPSRTREHRVAQIGGTVRLWSLRCGVIAGKRRPPRAAGPRRGPVPGCQPCRDLLGLGAADLGDVRIGAAMRLLRRHRGVLPAQLPGHLLVAVGDVPETGIVVVAAGLLADHGERLTAASRAGGEERYRNREARVQVGIAVIADRASPVAADGGQVVVEVAVPAATRAIIGDRPGQPVPLHGAGRVFGVQDQPGQPFPAQDVVVGLVAGQPGAARRVAELGVDGPSAGGQVGDLLPAAGAGPGQRRKAADVAAGQVTGRALRSAEQRSRPGAGADPVLLADHAGYVLAGPVVTGGRGGVPR